MRPAEPLFAGALHRCRANRRVETERHDPHPHTGADHAFLLSSLVVAAVAIAAPAAASSEEHSQLRPKTIYLTFDDGPDPRWTPQVLDLLRRYDAHATFFVVGASVSSSPALARRIIRDGHMLGNHTYSHADLTSVSTSRFHLELERAQQAIRRATGVSTRWLRPPYGAVSASVRSLAAAHGYRISLWDVDTQDWRRPGASTISATVLSRARSGSTVLMHDGGGDRTQTVAALREILRTLTARGYAFRPLPA